MKRISEVQAKDAVKKFVDNVAYGNHLRLINGEAIALPQGWRFPFNFFIQNIRVRSTMLVLYVGIKQDDKQNINVIVERNDLTSKNVDEITKLLQLTSQEMDGLATITEAKDLIKKKYPKALILKVEPVYDYTNYNREKRQSIPIFQRVNFLWNSIITTILVGTELAGNDQEKKLFLCGLKPKTMKRAASPLQIGWPAEGKRALRYITLDLDSQLKTNKNLLITYADLKNRDDIRGQWAALGCMTVFVEFIRQNKLDKRKEFDLYKIKIIQDNALHKSPRYSHDTSIPTIIFGTGEDGKGSWAEDPSIVFHELGHALRGHFYAGYLEGVHSTNKKAIGEGFADYFAAMLLHDPKPEVEDWDDVLIGGNLPKSIGGLETIGLPRLINGSPSPNLPLVPDDIHSQGKMWANFLWAFRRQYCARARKSNTRIKKAKQLDQIVLSVHLETSSHFSAIDGRGLPLWRSYVDIFKQGILQQQIKISDGMWEKLVLEHKILELD